MTSLIKTLSQQQSNDLLTNLKASLISSIESLTSAKIHLRVLNSQVGHEVLIPEGDKFRILIEVEVHPKIEKKDSP